MLLVEETGIEVSRTAVKVRQEVFERSEISDVVVQRARPAHGWRAPSREVAGAFVAAMATASFIGKLVEQRSRSFWIAGFTLMAGIVAVFAWMAPSKGRIGSVTLVFSNGSMQQASSSWDESRIESVERAIRTMLRLDEGP